MNILIITSTLFTIGVFVFMRVRENTAYKLRNEQMDLNFDKRTGKILKIEKGNSPITATNRYFTMQRYNYFLTVQILDRNSVFYEVTIEDYFESSFILKLELGNIVPVYVNRNNQYNVFLAWKKDSKILQDIK